MKEDECCPPDCKVWGHLDKLRMDMEEMDGTMAAMKESLMGQVTSALRGNKEELMGKFSTWKLPLGRPGIKIGRMWTWLLASCREQWGPWMLGWEKQPLSC